MIDISSTLGTLYPYAPYIGAAGALGAGVALLPVFQRFFLSMRFAYSNARLSARNNRYLQRDELDALAGSTLSEVITAIGEGYLPMKDADNYHEAERSLHLKTARDLVDAVDQLPVSARPFFMAILERYRLDVLREVVRTVLLNEPMTLDPGELELLDKGTRELVSMASDAEQLNELGTLLKDKLPTGENTDITPGLLQDPARIDHMLDSFYLKNMEEEALKATPSIRKDAMALASMLKDCYNIKALIRGKVRGLPPERMTGLLYGPSSTLGKETLGSAMEADDLQSLMNNLSLTPYFETLSDALRQYEEEGDATVFDVALDRAMVKLSVKLSMSSPLKLGPSIRYVVGRQMETRNLRILLRSSAEGLPANKVMDLMILEGA